MHSQSLNWQKGTQTSPRAKAQRFRVGQFESHAITHCKVEWARKVKWTNILRFTMAAIDPVLHGTAKSDSVKPNDGWNSLSDTEGLHIPDLYACLASQIVSNNNLDLPDIQDAKQTWNQSRNLKSQSKTKANWGPGTKVAQAGINGRSNEVKSLKSRL